MSKIQNSPTLQANLPDETHKLYKQTLHSQPHYKNTEVIHTDQEKNKKNFKYSSK